MKIGIDIMGGDFAPQAIVEGVVLAQKELPSNIKIVLIGKKEVAEAQLKGQGADLSLFEIVHAEEVIDMGEHPAKAFSSKPDSSIVKGFQLLKRGELNCFASVGNTGAMLVGSMLTIKAVSGVIRPCITTAVPKPGGGITLILDVGTNVDCKPDVLYQFGILGNLYAKHVYNISNPRVGLLNIGEEPEKGNMLSQAAHQLMKNTADFNFIGNVEGRDLFSDAVDVIVTDGFTGNVILKQAEAFYSLIKKRGRSDEFFDLFNYELYGGTPVLGVNGNVMIGHGISSPLAIKNLLLQSKTVVEAALPEKIKLAFN